MKETKKYTLREILSNIDYSEHICIGMQSGFVYSGTVQEYCSHTESIEDHLMDNNRKHFYLILKKLAEHAEAGNLDGIAKCKKRLAERYKYLEEFEHLNDRVVIDMYRRTSDKSICIICEGTEKMNM